MKKAWLNFGCLGVLGMLASGDASATWPDDIVLSELGTWNGATVEQDVPRTTFDFIVNELGTAIANKPTSPAETLGVNGFDIGLTSSLALIHSRDESSSDPSPWSRVHPDGTPQDMLWIPGIQVRKGLPLSLEMGASIGYISFSRQTVFGGWARWGLMEGYWPIPDFSIQLGYAGYVGNEELELGVMDTSITMGYTLPFGTVVGINQARFSPFIGAGLLRIHAAPRLDDQLEESLGLAPVSGFQGSDYYDPAFRHFSIQGGFMITNGDFRLRISTAITPDVLPTLNAGLGFTY